MYTGLKEYLQTLGWDVLTVQDVKLTGASDKKIVEYAEKNGLARDARRETRRPCQPSRSSMRIDF